MFNFKQYDWKRYNISLVIVVIILCISSAFFVKFAGESSGQGTVYFKRQLLGLLGGLFVMAFMSILDYHFVCRFVAVFYILSILLVAATWLTPLGTDLNTGTYRWLDLKVINFQPSELTKITLILALSTFYTKFHDKIDKFYTLILAVIIMAIPTYCIYKQPHLSSTMVMLFIFAMMVLASGIHYKILAPILGFCSVIFLGLLWYIQQPYPQFLKPYQIKRVVGFFNQQGNEMGTMYQQLNSIEAIASGKVYGKMLLDNGISNRDYNSVSVNESDFIFSIIGEELGFIGSCFILCLLAFIIIKCILVAKKAKDFTGFMIAVGLASMFIFQIFANIGVATSILPNTGLPLPFLSYGLSSMISNMIGIGLILNISLQTSKLRY